MLMHLKHFSRWTTLVLCSLILTTLLIACGPGGGSPPTSTSTQPPAPSSPSPSTAMATLTGNGFTMSYPQNWLISRSGSHLVTITDSTGTMKLSITIIPDPKGSISATSLLNTGIKVATGVLKDAQTESVPPTTTIGGQSWDQGSVSGSQRLNNRDIVQQVVVIATVHPASTALSKGFTIDYRAPKSMFNQANTTYFQPMLQSFKFV
jgi:hypothetical protein